MDGRFITVDVCSCQAAMVLLEHSQSPVYQCMAQVDQMKTTVKAKRKGLLASMRDMPDHNLSVSPGPFSQWRMGVRVPVRVPASVGS
jgi:anthranilate/para-aminobenzoate synthase component II